MAHFKRKSDKIAHIQAIPLFAKLSQKELTEVARHCDEVSFDARQVLANEAKPGDECFIIVTGKVEVRRNRRKLTTKGPGEIVGEMALLDELPRSATLVTTEPTNVLVFSRREFRLLIGELPSVSRKLLETLSERLRETDKSWLG